MGSEGDSDAHLSRAVRETLDSVVAPMIREALIHDALTLVGLKGLPTTGPAMRAFAKGPLREVTVQALGVELADSLTEEILRTLEASPLPWAETPPSVSVRPAPPAHRVQRSPAPAGYRRSSTPAPASLRRTTTLISGTPKHRQAPSPAIPPTKRSSRRRPTPLPAVQDAAPRPPVNSGFRHHAATRPTDPAAPSGQAPPLASMSVPKAPLVLVSTDEKALLDTLVEWFDRRADVRSVESALEVVRHFAEEDGRRTILILDGKCPSVRPAALAVLLEDLPAIEVVLCRATLAIEEVVLSASPSTSRWLVYRDPASLDHVAAECVRLVS
jgi:hypothetical protein